MDQPERHHTTVEHTSPLWRLIGVASAFGAIAALGFYFEHVGLGDEFATVAVITVFFSLGYWADKRPDRMRRRFGPFGKIAEAVRESRGDLRRYVYDRPLRVGVMIAVGYGIVIVLSKSAVVAFLGAIYSWHLAVALGAAIGAVVIAPRLFGDLVRRVSEGPQDYEQYWDDALADDGLEDPAEDPGEDSEDDRDDRGRG